MSDHDKSMMLHKISNDKEFNDDKIKPKTIKTYLKEAENIAKQNNATQYTQKLENMNLFVNKVAGNSGNNDPPV